MTFETMTNPLRPKLHAGGATHGVWITLQDPSVTELICTLGVDWVLVDMEHGALTCKDVLAHARAAKGTGVAVLTRIPSLTMENIKRALDLGIDGVIVPYIRSAAEVDEAFRYGRYPPRGERGIGGERAVHWGLRMQEYLAAADTETLIIPLIETKSAVEEIEAILAVDGLEAIFFGPADLSASCGSTGEWEGPGVAETILRVREKAQARGVASGIMGQNPDDLTARRDQGFQLIGLGPDIGFVAGGVKALLSAQKGVSYDHKSF